MIREYEVVQSNATDSMSEPAPAEMPWGYTKKSDANVFAGIIKRPRARIMCASLSMVII